jgi:hypothetical protein
MTHPLALQATLHSALLSFVIALTLICIALVPFVICADPGLARRIVPIDSLPVTRWPALLTRIGAACLVASFAVLLVGCYLILSA